jgi:FKBP-type peptidyl-prolyl cis-trans isomerase (trigger factor)
MPNYKSIITEKICYTALVYQRINKKLKLELSNAQIEKMILEIIKESKENDFQKIGKNIYINCNQKNVRLTINSFTNRIITADILRK